MAVICINYDVTDKKISYYSVDISFGSPLEVKVFDCGNFVKDWYNMIKFMCLHISETEHHFCKSSTVDHFIMDDAPFDSAWLKTIDGKPTLIYEYEEDRIEFFVPQGTQPTWEELKEMCK